MQIPKAINSALAFVLELAMLASFGYWGFQGDKSIWLKWGLGIGIPLAVAILWGLLLAPRAGRRLGSTGGIALSLVLFCLAATGLYQTGQPVPAIIFASIAVINRLLVLLWKQW